MNRELLKQVLDALEYHIQQTRPIHPTNLAIEALKAELAKPEPEPVAWLARNGIVFAGVFRYREVADAFVLQHQKNHDLSGSLAAFNVIPLYAKE